MVHAPFSDIPVQKMVIEKRIRKVAGTYHQQCRGVGVFDLIDGFILILC